MVRVGCLDVRRIRGLVMISFVIRKGCVVTSAVMLVDVVLNRPLMIILVMNILVLT